MENGILQVTLSKPGGILVGIQYNGIENLLELYNKDLNGGFWDLNWSNAGSQRTRGQFDTIKGTDFKVIVENEEQVELSFTRMWDPSVEGKQAPLYIDRRFIMLRGSSGFYSYGILEHREDMPAFKLNTLRIAFMLNKDMFNYMVVTDNRQRLMPSAEDRLPERGKQLAYPEAVLLVDPIEPQFKGEVDDKYQYSKENKDNKVHGWISRLDQLPSQTAAADADVVGFWQITPSNEFRNGGPFKQDLTSHVNPSTLAIFGTSHYAGQDLLLKFGEGEKWKKVFGPVFIYLNSVSVSAAVDALSLWDDANLQMNKEVQSWPYSFPASEDFPTAEQRGKLRGRLLVQESYVSEKRIVAKGAYVGLAAPGEVGSWQRESKGYQFWSRADEEGNFAIENIRVGTYNLYASVPGIIGDYKYDNDIAIVKGCDTDVGYLVYEPPRNGPTLWEIGIPDRSAAEFFIPDPNPIYVNRLYINHPDRFRQYGLWERYTELYPDEDLVYTIAACNYSKDWFFAQVTRKISEDMYGNTTWQIKFKLEFVDHNGTYKLRLALASAHNSDLQVHINDWEGKPPLFSSGNIGMDNAIARHGIHGLYWLFSVDIAGADLVEGDNLNTIFLTQAKSSSPFQGIMYDYIRLEAPPSSSSA